MNSLKKQIVSLAFDFCSNKGRYDLLVEIKRAMELKAKLRLMRSISMEGKKLGQFVKELMLSSRGREFIISSFFIPKTLDQQFKSNA